MGVNMEQMIRVGIADAKLCKTPDKITTVGLGSCIGIVLYSATHDVCGMVHIMLPSSKEIKNNANRAKFADTGIEDLVKMLDQKGVKKGSLLAKIAGGATMFVFSGSSDLGSIGERNIKSVKDTLSALSIPIIAEDTGADYGRTIIFDNTSKKLTVRCAGRADKVI